MWARVARRCLTTPLKRDVEMQRRLWQYTGVYAGFVGMVYLAFKGYQRYRDPPSARLERTNIVHQTALTKSEFTGIPRPSDSDSLISLLKNSIVVLFHPLTSGKSELISYIKATSERPCLVVKGMSTMEETLQQFGFQATPVGVINISTFQDTLEDALRELKNPILVLENIDQMPAVLRKRLLLMGYRRKRAGTGDTIVVSRDTKTISEAKGCGAAEVYVLKDLEKGDFEAVGRTMGLTDGQVQDVYASCGPCIDILTQIKTRQISPTDYIASLHKDLKNTLIEVIAAKPHLKPLLQKAIETVSSTYPLGNIFTGTELARILTESNLTATFPEGSTRFRHKIAVDVVREILA